MKKFDEIQKICLSHDAHVYRHVFKKFFFYDFCVQPVTRRNQNALPIKPPVFNVNNGTNNTREPTSASNNASREPAVG